MAEKIASLSQTGITVGVNIAHFRAERRLSLVELSRRLADGGRPIPPLGISRIEALERRVDSDDLVALAIALEVNPNVLLFPRTARRDIAQLITGVKTAYSEFEIWHWARGDFQLSSKPVDQLSAAEKSREQLRNIQFRYEVPDPDAEVF